MGKPLWTPGKERINKANMTRFIAFVNREYGLELTDYDDLYAWSIRRIPDFWEALWSFAGIRASRPFDAVLEDPVMPGAQWFRGARLNFAENLLRFRDARTALITVREGGQVAERLSYADLFDRVSRLTRFLRHSGVSAGDRVAAFVPNTSESVIAMLAATSLGAVWSSCSPDFGFKGVMDRFGQIAPKVLFTADGYTWNGKRVDSLERASKIANAVTSIEKVIVFPILDPDPDLAALPHSVLWAEALGKEAAAADFAQFPFDHPVYILYSSGTTGIPKCMVHGAGGTLLQHAKELILHTDLKREDVVFYFTTCGWMMWNWLLSALFAGSTVVLYDGSPVFPNAGMLWRTAADLGITVFGTSARFIDLCRKQRVRPGAENDLSRMRAVLSTGSPLSVEGFEWIYREVKEDLQLASICGGTDLVSCFMLGSPIDPVYPGEIQKRGLGMKVEAWSEEGKSMIGKKGELVCTAPFPSMPVYFWNDPDGSKYREAYFEDFPGVWRHGDYIEITPRGGVIVYGRSDATLNPGGVRIGTAEVYRVVEEFGEIADSLVVGQSWEGDVRIVLFVVMQEGCALDEELKGRLRETIRREASPRHVPAVILEAPAIPYTLNGKKVEIAVTKILQGEEVKNRDALAAPEVLDFYLKIKGSGLPAETKGEE
jgi:acetoacetyl-CoA synthetase